MPKQHPNQLHICVVFGSEVTCFTGKGSISKIPPFPEQQGFLIQTLKRRPRRATPPAADSPRDRKCFQTCTESRLLLSGTPPPIFLVARIAFRVCGTHPVGDDDPEVERWCKAVADVEAHYKHKAYGVMRSTEFMVYIELCPMCRQVAFIEGNL